MSVTDLAYQEERDIILEEIIEVVVGWGHLGRTGVYGVVNIIPSGSLDFGKRKMPRTEIRPHYVTRTRKDHPCIRCGGIIPRGSFVRYKNLFTGKRGYMHFPNCPPREQSDG